MRMRRKPVLPPGKYRMGGVHFKDDQAFIDTAVRDVRRLERTCGLTEQSALLDWGCGAGRLAVGVRERFGRVRDYHGVDIQPDLIGWAQANLADPGSASPAWMSATSATTRTAPLIGRSAPIRAAWMSWMPTRVFSHMTDEDTAAYLGRSPQPDQDRARDGHLLRGGGRSHWEENPPGYGPLDWKGRLHCTRFDRRHFEELVAAANLAVDRFVLYGRESDGHSQYVLLRPRQA
jgi:hypothetical protein